MQQNFRGVVPVLPAVDVDAALAFYRDTLGSIVESRGATIVEPPEDKPWGYRQFTIRDVNGHLLHYFRFSSGVE